MNLITPEDENNPVKALSEYTADDLPQLAAMAKHESDLAGLSARTAIQHALNAGRILNRADRLVKHGNWKAWVKENIKGVSLRTCQKYMKLAREWNGIPDSMKAPSTAHLTIDKALEALAKPTRKSAMKAIVKERPVREATEAPADRLGFNVDEALDHLRSAVRNIVNRFPSKFRAEAVDELRELALEIELASKEAAA